jgi:hypothetical protein
MTPKVLFGIPTGWWIYASWTEWFLQWVADQSTFEKEIRFSPANTKCVAYSDLIEKAKETDADYLVILETNHVVEISLQELYDRISHFNCVSSPVQYPNRGYLVDPAHYDEPFEITTGSTGLVALSKKAFYALVPRMHWDLHEEGSKRTGPFRTVPIYCFDCDVVEGTILDLPSSLFNNLRTHGIGLWADPAIRTQNLRLHGWPSYR